MCYINRGRRKKGPKIIEIGKNKLKFSVLSFAHLFITLHSPSIMNKSIEVNVSTRKRALLEAIEDDSSKKHKLQDEIDHQVREIDDRRHSIKKFRREIHSRKKYIVEKLSQQKEIDEMLHFRSVALDTGRSMADKNIVGE